MANLKDTIRTTMVAAIPTSIGATSRIVIRTGSAPSKTAAPTGTLLSTLTPSATFSAPGAAGIQTANAIANDTNAAATGTPGYGRIIDGTVDDGTHTQLQFTCAIGSGEMNFSSGIVVAGTVSITSLTITDGTP